MPEEAVLPTVILGPEEAREIGFKYTALGVATAAILPLLITRSLLIIRYWYLAWWGPLLAALAMIAFVVWRLAPWVARSVARNRLSLAPPFLAVLALASGSVAGTASTPLFFGGEIRLSELPSYILGFTGGLLLFGSPVCLILGVLYHRELRRRIGPERMQIEPE